jgi:hypothetical protein
MSSSALFLLSRGSLAQLFLRLHALNAAHGVPRWLLREPFEAFGDFEPRSPSRFVTRGLGLLSRFVGLSRYR